MNIREGDEIEIVQNDRLCRCVVESIRRNGENENEYVLRLDGYTYTFEESKLQNVLLEG